ncbi:MAG: hypothetical protein R3B95_11310 [Nitrospirales bacterium]|nr:hypothetical protein [Nitrospirales bacterium]
MNLLGRISNRSVGQFDPKNWLKEGDGLLASAKVVREKWIDLRQILSKNTPNSMSEKPPSTPNWNLLTGLPRSSMLLLGYSVEMYLKAGLTKAYYGCSIEMFERDVKRFGHKLFSLAKEIHFDFKNGDADKFDGLEKMVLVDARYPVLVPDGQSYSDVVNEQTRRIWSIENFDDFYALGERVREHVRAIDRDSNNPAIMNSWQVDQDGYLAFRAGGRLPPRITYRLSSLQVEAGSTSLDDMKSLFPSNDYILLNHYWDSAWIYEDCVKTATRKAKTVRKNPLQE